MKNHDAIIVSLLRENGRMSLTKMSRMTKIPVSTLYEKIKGLDNGLIRKHTTLIDFSLLGFSARARVLFKVRKTEMQKLKDHLLASPSLNELYKVNNGYDFMAEFIFQTMKEMEEYLDMLGEKYSLEKEEIFYLIDELRREEFLSKAHVLLLGEQRG